VTPCRPRFACFASPEWRPWRDEGLIESFLFFFVLFF
jgi:hypothetical protein